MVILLVIAGAIGGAILGSFLATLVIRWPTTQSALTGRSRCDACGQPLTIRDLIPILSSLIQRGRCRACHAPIDPLHLRVEVMCALIGGLALALRPDLAGAALAIMGWLLVPLGWLDARHQWLPDPLNLLLAAGGVLLGGFLGVALIDRLIGATVGFASLWALAAAYRRLRGREGMGGGDPKLLGAIGAWIGWEPLAPVLALAAFIGLIVAAVRRLDRTAALPFGMVLAPAGWIAAAVMMGRG